MGDSPVKSAFRILAGTTIGAAVIGFVGSKLMPEPAKPQVKLSAQVQAEMVQERVNLGKLKQIAQPETRPTLPPVNTPASLEETARRIEQLDLNYASFRTAYGNWEKAPPELMWAQFKSLGRRLVAAPPGLEAVLLSGQMADISMDLHERARHDEKLKLGRKLTDSEEALLVASGEAKALVTLGASGNLADRFKHVISQIINPTESLQIDYMAHFETATPINKLVLSQSLLNTGLAGREIVKQAGVLVKGAEDRTIPAPELTEAVSRELYGRMSGYVKPGQPVRMQPAQLTETLTLLHGPWGDIWRTNLNKMGFGEQQVMAFEARVGDELRATIESPAQAARPNTKPGASPS
jgi:hypothetical protein